MPFVLFAKQNGICNRTQAVPSVSSGQSKPGIHSLVKGGVDFILGVGQPLQLSERAADNGLAICNRSLVVFQRTVAAFSGCLRKDRCISLGQFVHFFRSPCRIDVWIKAGTKAMRTVLHVVPHGLRAFWAKSVGHNAMWDVGWSTCLPDDLRPLRVKHLAFGLVEALVGVGAEEVALGLEEVRGEAGGAVAVVVAEAGAEGGHGDAVE